MNIKKMRESSSEPSDIVNAFIKDINKYKLLTPTEEKELVERMLNGDEEAKEKLITANQRFVYTIAKRYGNEDNLLDLVNEGNLGLMMALETFDQTRGNRFLSYAIWYIKREINAYLNNENHLIRKTNNSKTVYKINKVKSKFFAEHGRYPDIDEMAEILEEEYGLKIKDKGDLLDISTTSISTCFDDEDGCAFENSTFFTEKTATENNYEDETNREQNSFMSDTLMVVLDDRERLIISMAFGIGQVKEYTNAEIGEKIGMSSERVRQIKNEALEKMRSEARAHHISI